MITCFRRAASTLVLAAAAAAGVVAAAPSPAAWACSPTSHCYAVAQINTSSTNHGIAGQIFINCMLWPNDTEGVSQEVWDGNGSYWIELGAMSGEDYYGNYHTRDWFWADSRPSSGGFHQHFDPSAWGVPALNNDYAVQIDYTGSDTWEVLGGNQIISMGHSRSQPVSVMQYENGGTEYTVNSGSGLADEGNVTALEYQATNGNWHYWSINGFDASSSGNWLSHSWSTKYSQETYGGTGCG